MIEAEDEKRKKVLEGKYRLDLQAIDVIIATQQSPQEDFSWDDDPDEPTVKAAPSADTMPNPSHAPPNPQTKKATMSTSPRDSEESYDLVSDQGAKAPNVNKALPAEDEDSDWE